MDSYPRKFVCELIAMCGVLLTPVVAPTEVSEVAVSWFEVLSGCLFVTQAGRGVHLLRKDDGLGGRFVTEKVIFARVVGLIKVNHIEEEVNLISRGEVGSSMAHATRFSDFFFYMGVIIESYQSLRGGNIMTWRFRVVL